MLENIPKEYMKEFETSMKVGLIATINENNEPHITIISTLQANTPKQMIWGQFIEGLSKVNVRTNNKTGFLIMNLKKEFWSGKAIWTHEKRKGPEYIMYNKKPMYRYNSYFGIHTVHYMDLVEISQKNKLNIRTIAGNAIKTKFSKGGIRSNSKQCILKPWAKQLFNNMKSLKFLSYIDNHGFPIIIPIIQAQAADSTRIVFSTSPYRKELDRIPQEESISIYCLNLEMENVLVIGKFKGFKRSRGIQLGVMDIERVYNSMPPKQGYIFPEHKTEAIIEF